MSSAIRITRLRWGVHDVLAFGVAASITANMLHARPNAISQTIAGSPSIAVLLSVELISGIHVTRRRLAVRVAAIAGIAAWVSCWSMAGSVIRSSRVARQVDLGSRFVNMSVPGREARRFGRPASRLPLPEPW